METYSVLIADDEYWTREKLKTMLNWEEYGLRLLEAAKDGEEVQKRMESEKPDILITDINMPFVNGVELLQFVQEHYPDTITFVISGYNDFDYVKDSFMAGSINYLMKPIGKIELVNAISKALELISAKSSKKKEEENQKTALVKASSLMRDREFSQLLVSKDNTFSPNMISNSVLNIAGSSLLLIKIHDLSQLAIKYQHDINQLSLSLKQWIQSVLNDSEMIIFNHIYRSNEFIIISEKEQNELISMANRLLMQFETITASPITIAMSEQSYSSENIYQAYTQAVSLLMTRSFTRRNVLITDSCKKDAVSSKISDSQVKNLEILLQTGNRKAVEELIMEQIGLRDCQKTKWNYLVVKQTIRRIMNVFGNYIEKSGQQIVELEGMAEIVDKAIELLDIGILCETIENILDVLLREGQEDYQESTRGIVRQAAEYIQKHYFESLSLSGLSQQFHMETSYFSRMFRKEMGENLMSYILRIRMNAAKELMKKETMNLTEIAFMVGYDDYTYFNKVFRKLEGIGPREYRRIQEKG